MRAMKVGTVALALVLASSAAWGVTYKIDMAPSSVTPPPAGWVRVWGSDASSQYMYDHTGAALGGGAYAGFSLYVCGEGRTDRPVPPGPWLSPYDVVLKDFCHPWTGQLILWNIPAGQYDVTVYMRDQDYGREQIYRLLANDGQMLEVNDSSFVAGNLASLSDTKRISTVVYDPDGAGSYVAQPSLYFDRGGNSYASLLGLELTLYEPPSASVAEPASLGLSLLGLPLLLRRRA